MTLVVDPDLKEAKRECMVNQYDALLGKLGEKTYLCWTLSLETSCVIEYDAEKTAQEEIFSMAQSISLKKAAL